MSFKSAGELIVREALTDNATEAFSTPCQMFSRELPDMEHTSVPAFTSTETRPYYCNIFWVSKEIMKNHNFKTNVVKSLF